MKLQQQQIIIMQQSNNDDDNDYKRGVPKIPDGNGGMSAHLNNYFKNIILIY